MASLTITTRQTKSGRRFVVRYRLGGRAYPIVHGGSFKTLKEARGRREFIGGEIAAGRDPAVALKTLLEAPTAVRTLADWSPLYLASRHDVANLRAVEGHLRRIVAELGDREPQTLAVADCQTFLAELVTGLKPESVKRYWGTFRLLLDFCEVDPNPARDRRIKLPSVVQDEPTPPTAKQFLAILDKITDRRKVLRSS
jgi:hypothetical protein